ncbi:serine/threonine-protein phosphatase [Actinomyces sp. zg-332]|uniref:PP2C family protein-serine/threonine phosphatase n=1 Tax=Actinomyces sp. zg-332 TaxID=2708340 RepID=UPI001423953C|nr:PP2C family serine/threonine-protein phosphatase [Actinomyces sp. zg-332]QPK94174.1 serine/threonine-protein phosphatase [Actinomyces sp. zg-332]
MSKTKLRFAARSDIGMIRKQNQDSGYAGENLCVLADGMGGPAGGDIASSVAISHLKELDAPDIAVEEMIPLIREKVAAAHEELIERSSNNSELVGLGTTCIAVLKSGDKLAMAHIGDSRAYILRDGVIQQITVDHSFVQYLVQTGQLTPKEAENHPRRSMLLRVLGDSITDVTLDESMREAVIGDRYLLCSDGLSGVVSSQTMQDVMNTVKDPDECCEKLISLALRGGGPDNITCVIFDVISADEQDESQTRIVGAASTDRLEKIRREQTPAAMAAEHFDKTSEKLNEKKKKTPTVTKPKKSHKKGIIATLVTLFILCGISTGLFFAYSWTQGKYFITQNNKGQVVLYKGIPQTVVGFDLFEPQYITDIDTHDLPHAYQQTLKDNISFDNLSEAKKYINRLDNIQKEYIEKKSSDNKDSKE